MRYVKMLYQFKMYKIQKHVYAFCLLQVKDILIFYYVHFKYTISFTFFLNRKNIALS